MTFLGVDEDRIVRPLIPEFQKVSASFDGLIKEIVPELQRAANSFETLMYVLLWVVIICLIVYVWRQHAEEQRAKEAHAWPMLSLKRPYVLPDSVAASEVERLIKENEALKRVIHEKGITIKEQSDVNEELQDAVNAGVAALTQKRSELSAKEAELQKVKDDFRKIRSFMSSFETMFQCQVCMDLLHQPYVVSPCGHVFCLHCLQEWFRRSPVGRADEGLGSYILSCPCCRTRVTYRPVPLFVLRDALAELRVQLCIQASPDRSLVSNHGDPWVGFFSSQV